MPLSQAQQSPRSPSEAQERQRSRNRRALAIAAALLLIERRTERAVAKSAERLDAIGADAASTASAIASTAAAIVLKARALARDVSRDAMTLPDGAAQPALGDVQGALGVQADQAAAERAGASVARRYVEVSADPEVTDAVAALDGQIHKVSVTESWDALNDETRRTADRAAAVGADLWLVWSALADACERCHDRHGERVHVSEGMADWPPLHAHCRCVVLTETE